MVSAKKSFLVASVVVTAGFVIAVAEKSPDLCDANINLDDGIVEETAAYSLFGSKVAPCLATGTTLPITIGDHGTVFVTDASGVQMAIGESRSEGCPVLVSDDLSRVEEQAAFVIDDVMASGCRPTGTYLPVMNDQTGFYVIDADAERIDIGDWDTSVCDIKFTDDQTAVEQYGVLTLDGTQYGSCKPTGKTLPVLQDSRGLYLVDGDGRRVELGPVVAN